MLKEKAKLKKMMMMIKMTADQGKQVAKKGRTQQRYLQVITGSILSKGWLRVSIIALIKLKQFFAYSSLRYSSEATHPASCKKRLNFGHPSVAVCYVGCGCGLLFVFTNQFKIGCHFL